MKTKIVTNSVFYLMITAAFAVFFFGCKTVQSNETLPQNQAIVKASPVVTPVSEQIPPMEIKSDEVSLLVMETVYKNYFPEGDKCRKTYNEYFGNADGAGSSSSPCTINIAFERTGGATKTLLIKRYDKAERKYKIVENSIWTAKISSEQFDALARSITENAAFKAWQEGTDIYVSNSKISAVHTKGTRTVLSNADEKTLLFLPMLDAFRESDGKLKWEKVL